MLLFLLNLRTAYTVISVVGIVGNLLCIVVLLGHAPLRRKPANYFLISQSIVDLLASIFLLLTMNVLGLYPVGGPLYAVICYLWASRTIFLGLFMASLFNITALTVERYFKTVHPVQHRIRMTKNRLRCVIVAVCVSGVLLKMPYALGGTSINHNGTCIIQTYASDTISVIVGTYNFLVEYLIPLLIIAFCYIQMMRSLRRNIRQAPAAAAPAASSRGTVMARARRNILKTLLIVVLVFVACTTFKQILLLAKVVGHVPLDYAGLAFNVSQVMSFMVCCTNPIIYLAHYQEFRVGMRTMFTRRSNTIHPEPGKSCVPHSTLEEATLYI